jgi:hypothetical protein
LFFGEFKGELMASCDFIDHVLKDNDSLNLDENDKEYLFTIRECYSKLKCLSNEIIETIGKYKNAYIELFADEEIIKTYVDTAEDLQDIINGAQSGEETNIVIGGDIDLGDLLNAGLFSTRAAEPTYGLLIPAGKEVVLDLNGFTISQTKSRLEHTK